EAAPPAKKKPGRKPAEEETVLAEIEEVEEVEELGPEATLAEAGALKPRGRHQPATIREMDLAEEIEELEVTAETGGKSAPGKDWLTLILGGVALLCVAGALLCFFYMPIASTTQTGVFANDKAVAEFRPEDPTTVFAVALFPP